MALTSGTKLGPYEIQSPLGAGGMGEVYRARDTRLNRDVAVKILPEAFARDAERMRRFEQEARAVAALSHRAASPSTRIRPRAPLPAPTRPRFFRAGVVRQQGAPAPAPKSPTADWQCRSAHDSGK
jgi:serine/threonine protein kinase